jgi:hypothetical protein
MSQLTALDWIASEKAGFPIGRVRSGDSQLGEKAGIGGVISS